MIILAVTPHLSHAYQPSSSRRRQVENKQVTKSRRAFLTTSFFVIGGKTALKPSLCLAEDTYIPPPPEERSGLVVLRVAEVAQFQEKVLRAVAGGELPENITVTPQQISFGNQILLRNSNLDGNMKLMIYNEIPKRSRDRAIKDAVNVMNSLQDMVTYANSIQRPFEKEEMLRVADMYRYVRVQLNDMYELLPEKEKEKYYG